MHGPTGIFWVNITPFSLQEGDLTTKYDGGRPTHADYHPMRKQGGLILGTGGDNSDSSRGIFYEVSDFL
jgi:hypothetical protein